MSVKKKIVYFNFNAYLDTDITVLKYLSKDYNIIWIPLIPSINPKLSKDFILKYASENNIKTRIFEYNTRQSSWSFTKIVFKILLYIIAQKPDLVFSSTRILQWAILSYLFLNKKKKLLAFHDVEYHSGLTYVKSLKIADWFLVRGSEHYAFYSKNQQTIFESLYPLVHTHLLGMSVKDYGVTSTNAKLNYECIKILFFGRIEFYKGLDILIEAIEKINKKSEKKIHLSIYGKGDYWDVCKKKIKEIDYYNLNIRFVQNEELPDIMATHHYLALPYRDATQSGPIMIAANYGLPIFASNIPSFKDIYDDRNAFFYDIPDIETALASIAAMSEDDYYYMRNNCQKLKEKFSEHKIYENYKVAIDTIL